MLSPSFDQDLNISTSVATAVILKNYSLLSSIGEKNSSDVISSSVGLSEQLLAVSGEIAVMKDTINSFIQDVVITNGKIINWEPFGFTNLESHLSTSNNIYRGLNYSELNTSNLEDHIVLKNNLVFDNSSIRIMNLPPADSSGQPVEYSQLISVFKELSDIQGNINIKAEDLIKSLELDNNGYIINWTPFGFSNLKDHLSTSNSIYRGSNYTELDENSFGDHVIVKNNLVFDNSSVRIMNLPPADASGQPVEYSQLLSVFEKISDIQGNVTLSSDNIGLKDLFDASLNAFDASINAFNDYINAFDASINAFDASINSVGATINVLDTSVTVLDTSVNMLDTSVTVLDTSVNILDIKVKEYDTSFNTIINPKLNQHDVSINNLYDDKIVYLTNLIENNNRKINFLYYLNLYHSNTFNNTLPLTNAVQASTQSAQFNVGEIIVRNINNFQSVRLYIGFKFTTMEGDWWQHDTAISAIQLLDTDNNILQYWSFSNSDNNWKVDNNHASSEGIYDMNIISNKTFTTAPTVGGSESLAMELLHTSTTTSTSTGPDSGGANPDNDDGDNNTIEYGPGGLLLDLTKTYTQDSGSKVIALGVSYNSSNLGNITWMRSPEFSIDNFSRIDFDGSSLIDFDGSSFNRIFKVRLLYLIYGTSSIKENECFYAGLT